MIVSRQRIGVAALAALASLTPAQAYYHYVHYLGRNGPFNPIYEKFDLNALGPAKTVTFFVTDQGPTVYAPNDSFGSLLGQVRQAVTTWDLSTSDLRVAFGGLESQGQRSNAPSRCSPAKASSILARSSRISVPQQNLIFLSMPQGHG